MGIPNTSAMKVAANNDCAKGTELEPRLLKDGVIVVRESFGDVTTGAAFECDGHDVCIVGEEDGQIVYDHRDCPCKSGFNSGLYKERNLAGDICLGSEPAPRNWCVESQSQNSSSNGPPGPAGQIELETLSLSIKAACWPLIVRPYIQVCSWEMYPENVKDVGGYIEWEVSNTPADSDKQTRLTSNKCVPAGLGRWGGSYRMGCFEIAGRETIDITAAAGFQYFNLVENSFDSNLSNIQIFADVWQITSRGVSVGEDDC